MTGIPEDILARSIDVWNRARAENSPDAIAEALMAEREAATQAERDRSARIHRRKANRSREALMKPIDTSNFSEIDRLTKELDSNLSAYMIARKAMKWTGYVTDQAMVSRKLMAVDHAIMALSALVPDDFIGGEAETPQEYAAAVASILKAEHAMNGVPQ